MHSIVINLYLVMLLAYEHRDEVDQWFSTFLLWRNLTQGTRLPMEPRAFHLSSFERNIIVICNVDNILSFYTSYCIVLFKWSIKRHLVAANDDCSEVEMLIMLFQLICRYSVIQ